MPGSLDSGYLQRRWVARRVRDVAGISNCYSTETEWDEDSGDVKEHAYEMGWISPQVPFNFAKAYGAMSLKHRAAQPRFFPPEQTAAGQYGPHYAGYHPCHSAGPL